MHKLGDTFYLLFPTHDSTGALSDADATPVVEVFEDASDSAMAYLPPVAKVGAYTGYYRATIVATGANGFEVWKSYNFMAAIKMDGTNIASRIDVILSLQSYDNDDLKTVIGAPVALDSGTASIAGMLVKMADDNGGADFDATTDSLEKIAAAISGGSFTVADIWEYIVTGLEPVGSSAELLTIAAGGPSITADAIARALLASPQADYMLDGTIGRSLFEASHGRVTPVIKNPVGDHIVDVDLSGVLRDKGALDRTACVAIAMDKTGRDSTSTLISRIVYLGQKARITLRGGEVAKAPYSVRIVVRTTLGFSYQHEIQVYVLGG